MALSPEEAFLSRDDRKQLIKLEKELMKSSAATQGGNGPSPFHPYAPWWERTLQFSSVRTHEGLRANGMEK